MKKLYFTVELLSDIVLPAKTNTEGNITPLDFIPGSNFLGIVAKKYNEFTNSFTIFHSGCVRFGDATPLYDEKQTYKVPLSFFHEKLEDRILYNHHLIEDFTNFKQLKQVRKGYITEELERLFVKYNYAQKSAYDIKTRRSKESSMYGYTAIKKGSKWLFSIAYDSSSVSEKDIGLLCASLLGKQQLGKSKSAEYGLVEITQSSFNDDNSIENVSAFKEKVILYAKSRLALIDNDGYPTYDLKYLCEGLDDSNILYEASQLRTSTFTPYNGARKTTDSERVCINKGSVIVLQNIDKEQLLQIKNGVGAYLSEGFGEVLINPSFLLNKSFVFKESQPIQEEKNVKTPVTTNIALFLSQKEEKAQEKLKLLDSVDHFIEKNRELYENIKPSQWGKIRSICKGSVNDARTEIRSYISTGTRKWSERQIETLLDEKNSIELIRLVAIEMPKKGEKNHD